MPSPAAPRREEEKPRWPEGTYTFHKGIDYAVILTPRQTTDSPLAQLYGQDRHVTAAGNLFAAAPDLYEALDELATLLGKAAALHPTRDLREVIADPLGLSIRARLLLSRARGDR